MNRPTRCEVCLQPTGGAACNHHPHADLVDEERDGLWLEALLEQRQQRAFRQAIPLAILATIGLGLILGPGGVLLGMSGLVMLTVWGRSTSTPTEANELLPADNTTPAASNEERALWLARRNRRVERANARDRTSASGRVQVSG